LEKKGVPEERTISRFNPLTTWGRRIDDAEISGGKERKRIVGQDKRTYRISACKEGVLKGRSSNEPKTRIKRDYARPTVLARKA